MVTIRQQETADGQIETTVNGHTVQVAPKTDAAQARATWIARIIATPISLR